MYDIKLMYEVGKLRMQECVEAQVGRRTPEPEFMAGRVAPDYTTMCCTATAPTANP